MRRLCELTAELISQRQREDIARYFHVIAKHAGKSLIGASREIEQDSSSSRDLVAVVKAAVAAGSTTIPGWASELVPYAGLTGNWVRAISATTLLGRIPYALVPFNTKTIVDGSGASGGWVAEGAVIPMARGSLSVTPMLGMKSVKAIFAVTDELLTSTAPANLANLEEIAARSVRFTMDRSMLDPSMAATAAQPASLTNGITPLASTGSTAAAVMSDLRALLQAVLDGGSPDFSSTVFVMSPTDALALSLLLTSGGQRAFPDLGATGGSIWGVPALVSKAADLGGSPPARIIAAIDGSRVLVADDGLMTVGASKAALQFTDAPVAGAANSISLYQTESTAIRLVLYKNFTRATAGCVAWMSVSY